MSISAVVPKRSPSKPKASSAVTKLVNAVCYGTLKDEKVATFITGVLELGDEDRQVRFGLRLYRCRRLFTRLTGSVHEHRALLTRS